MAVQFEIPSDLAETLQNIAETEQQSLYDLVMEVLEQYAEGHSVSRPTPPTDEEIAAVLESYEENEVAFAAGNYTTREEMIRMFEDTFGKSSFGKRPL